MWGATHKIDILLFKMAHFSCSISDTNSDIVILRQKKFDDIDVNLVSYIKYVVNYLIKHGCGDIIPKFYEFNQDERYITCQRMNEFSVINESDFQEWYRQAGLIADRLTEIKVHHNDMKPDNFVFVFDSESNTKKWYIIDFDMTFIFNDDFLQMAHMPKWWWNSVDKCFDDEWCSDFGWKTTFDPDFNRKNLKEHVEAFRQRTLKNKN